MPILSNPKGQTNHLVAAKCCVQETLLQDVEPVGSLPVGYNDNFSHTTVSCLEDVTIFRCG